MRSFTRQSCSEPPPSCGCSHVPCMCGRGGNGQGRRGKCGRGRHALHVYMGVSEGVWRACCLGVREGPQQDHVTRPCTRPIGHKQRCSSLPSQQSVASEQIRKTGGKRGNGKREIGRNSGGGEVGQGAFSSRATVATGVSAHETPKNGPKTNDATNRATNGPPNTHT
eukprot:359940-Chlamydomonas_euryale.AAC.2